jgi:hypothetical protein
MSRAAGRRRPQARTITARPSGRALDHQIVVLHALFDASHGTLFLLLSMCLRHASGDVNRRQGRNLITLS